MRTQTPGEPVAHEAAEFEVHALEANAAAELGLTPPVDFFDLRSEALLCFCSYRTGVLVDSLGATSEFVVRSELCPPGTEGLQWNCGLECDSGTDQFVEHPEKNRAVGVLLAVWLTREFLETEFTGLPDFDPRCHSPFDRIDRGSYVLYCSDDPAMVDLSLFLALYAT